MVATYPIASLVRSRIRDALRKHPAKVLARDGEASPRAADGWRAGRRTPPADTLAVMMLRNEELRHELLAALKELME